MIYEHESRESKYKGEGINTSPPPRPIKEQWALDLMQEYLSSRDLSYNLALMNGCYPCKSKDAVRIYIPARTRIKDHIYWQARAIEDSWLRYDSPQGPKRDALIVFSNKSYFNHLGLSNVVIVEGPLDALAVASLDSHIGISLMGNNPGQESLDHLADMVIRLKPLQVFCVADRDAVGPMHKIQSYLAMRGIMSQLKVPLDKKDLACYSVEERRRLLYDRT